MMQGVLVTLTWLVAVAVAADWCRDPLNAAAEKSYYGVEQLRRRTPTEVSNCDYPQCTRIYRVRLDRAYTTQCNDYGMLPPHGLNQVDDVTGCQNNKFYSDVVGQLKDWRNYPYPKSAEKQNAARARASVTALTEATGTGSSSDAFPMGYHFDTLHEYYGVCVVVYGVSDTTVPDRWVEIMGQAVQQDRSFCVRDWDSPELRDNVPQEACGGGELYQCRNSAAQKAGDPMKLMFYCKENCDATDMDFYWRIVSSHETSSQNSQLEKSDNEDWCAFRAGDDYPSSLLQPYPNNYNAPPVFEALGNSASTARSFSFPFLVLLALLVSLLFLL